MSEIYIVQNHSLPEPELRELLESVVEKMQQRYQLVPSWQGNNCVELKRSGVKGVLVYDDCQVELTIQLGLLMRPMRSTIENAVRQALADKLG